MGYFVTDPESASQLKHRLPLRVAPPAHRSRRSLPAVSSVQQDWLLPLALCCLGWLIYLSLAPWQYHGNQPWPPFQSLFAAAAPAAAFFTNLLLLTPVACFGQGALQRHLNHVPPVLSVLLLWAGLSLISLALAYAQLLFPPKVAPPSNLLAQQVGIVLGILLWWSAGRPLAAVLGTTDHRSHQRPFWHYAVLLGTLPVLLFPIDPTEPLRNLAAHWPPASLGVYLQDLQRHLSNLFKISMLWVPVGLVYTLGGYRQTLQVWMLAVVLAFVLLGLPLFNGLKAGDVLEVICALIGTEVGSEIGARTRWSSGFAAKMAARAAVPLPRPAVAFPVWAPTLLPRTLALGLLLGVVLSLLDFPRLASWLGAGLAAYALVLGWFPYAWLLAVPAVLPVLDFAPWTGRFFFDEFDRVMLVTLALALWHGRCPQPGPVLERPLPLLLTLFISSYLISLLLGLLPWQDLDANAFSNYWSHYNSLRVGKGMLWSLLVFALLRWGQLPEPGTAQRLFAIGIGSGLLGVILPDLWERWQFGNLLDFSRHYHPVAGFSSMGSDSSEVYLISAIPLLWLWLNSNPLLLLAGAIALLLALYFAVTMVAPSGLVALLMALGVLALGSWRCFKLTRRRLNLVELGILLLLVAGIGSSVMLQGSDLQATKDWRTYLNHWNQAVAMMDRNWTTPLFGMGLGRFPETYLYRNLEGVTPTTYRFEQDEEGNTFLRLGSGEPLYLAQRVPVTPQHRYTLYLDLRGSRKATRLDAALCEVQQLDASQCRWAGIEVPAGDTGWRSHELAFDSNTMEAGNRLIWRPVELLLYNPVRGTVVEIDNLRLVDEQGQDLLANGNFSKGADYWFGKTANSLPWRIGNLWVQLLFEQGWLGLLTFLLLLGVLLSRLAAALWRGDAFATALLASATAFLTRGLFDSEFDAPRLTVLLFSILWVGILTTAPQSYPK
jgi:hypothetical protein